MTEARGDQEAEGMNYRIAIHGCDDSTIFDMDLTDTEVATVRRMVALAAETSNYSCMPTIEVEERIAPATKGENISARTWPDNLLQNPEN